MSYNKTHVIHIPEIYWDISMLRSTLGHKSNHSFKSSNAKFSISFHPRFGEIKSLVATFDIKRGEEIITNYGYLRGSLVPSWYSDLYLSEIGEQWYGSKCRQ